MGKVNSEKRTVTSGKNSSNTKGGSGKFVLIGVGLLVVLILGYNFLGKGSNKNESAISNESSTNSVGASNLEGGIKIPKADISSTAKFYSYEASGIKMEVLAIKAKDGSIRTAFNTCQVCYPSGKGYYVQEGDELVCQNCGNRFKVDKVGISKNGCNPIPVLDNSKSDDGTNIVIAKDYLDKNKALFSNWKVQ